MKIRMIMDFFVGETKVGFKSWRIERFEGRRKIISDRQNHMNTDTNDRGMLAPL